MACSLGPRLFQSFIAGSHSFLPCYRSPCRFAAQGATAVALSRHCSVIAPCEKAHAMQILGCKAVPVSSLFTWPRRCFPAFAPCFSAPRPARTECEVTRDRESAASSGQPPPQRLPQSPPSSPKRRPPNSAGSAPRWHPDPKPSFPPARSACSLLCWLQVPDEVFFTGTQRISHSRTASFGKSSQQVQKFCLGGHSRSG